MFATIYEVFYKSSLE